MAEPVVPTGAIIATGIKIAETVYGKVDAILSAPKCIAIISSDVKAFYSILGTLQRHLDGVQCSTDQQSSAAYAEIEDVVKGSIDILKSFEAIVAGYLNAARTTNVTRVQAVKWAWKEQEVKKLRDLLAERKQTLVLAIGVEHMM